MKRTWLLLLLAFAVASCATEEAPEIPEGPVAWAVSASTDVSEVQVGDDLTLTLAIQHPPDGDFVPPIEADFEPFEVVEHWEEAVSPVETRLHYRLAAYRLPEDLELAALELRHRGDDGELAVIETEPIPVSLVTSLTPDVTEIHDIKDPVPLEVPRDWALLWWLLLALLAAVIAYIIYRKFRKEPEAVTATAWTPPLPPPDVEAEAALRRLAERKLIENRELELFFTELTDIVRRYAGRRFEVPYLERTSHEILMDLRDQKTPQLRAILESADLVKFAKTYPEQDEARKMLSLAHELVRETRPEPEPAETDIEPVEAPA